MIVAFKRSAVIGADLETAAISAEVDVIVTANLHVHASQNFEGLHIDETFSTRRSSVERR